MAKEQSPAETLKALLGLDNIAVHLSDEDLARIGEDVCRDHEIDRKSMSEWEARMKRGIELASLVKQEKSYPFEKAANIKYPLITTAALQFNARAYPAIVPSDDVVKVKVFGADQNGTKAARAHRVGSHMSYQLASQIEEWEETTDELLTLLPIVGTMIRKVWPDAVARRPRVRLIQPGRFVVNASVKTLGDAPRLGEELPLYPSEISSRRLSGYYRDIEYVEQVGEDRDAVQEFIEQHRRIDLDGDGYGEPYIVTVHRQSRKVARIVADFEPSDVVLDQSGKVVSISRGSYFIAYHFLPSIDGGFFGTGLGFLLGDISETINSIINMMLDAGHMSSRGGGFLGAEFRIKGGAQQFRPGEWKMINARGADVKSAIVPMTFPAPDATLFQLLGLLIEAGKDLSSVKDIMTGDTGGRSQTATTTMALIEQGMMVFTAAYKRVHRALKKEFRLIAKINSKNLSPAEYAKFHEKPIDPATDYDLSDMDIEPVSDPRSVTKMQEAAKAEIVMQLSREGMVDKAVASQRVLQAASIPNTEELLPKTDQMQQAMAEMQMQAAKADLTLKMVSVDQALADIEKTRSETVKNMSDAAAKHAQIRLDRAESALRMVRDGLEQALGRGAGGMAGAPGYGGPAFMSVGNPGDPIGGGGGGLLVGQPMAGGGPGFASAGQGFDGRPV